MAMLDSAAFRRRSGGLALGLRSVRTQICVFVGIIYQTYLWSRPDNNTFIEPYLRSAEKAISY